MPLKYQIKSFIMKSGERYCLLVVKINEDFEFESRMIDRKSLGKGEGSHARIDWGTMPDQ